MFDRNFDQGRPQFNIRDQEFYCCEEIQVTDDKIAACYPEATEEQVELIKNDLLTFIKILFHNEKK